MTYQEVQQKSTEATTKPEYRKKKRKEDNFNINKFEIYLRLDSWH